MILFHGNCLDLMHATPDKSIDLVVTDPPYKTVSGGCTTKKNAMTGVLGQGKKTSKAGTLFAENTITFAEWVPEVYPVLKDDTHCYIMINGRNLSNLQAECEKVGFKYQNLLVWNKGNLTPNKWYMNQCEFILMLRKGRAKNIRNLGSSTLINIPNIIGKKVHPTEKPVALMESLINNSSETGDLVLDPFAGSGSTGVACRNTGRNFVGAEIDTEYFEIASGRIFDDWTEKEGLCV